MLLGLLALCIMQSFSNKQRQKMSEIFKVREAAYRIFLHPDSHQEDLLQSLLTARHQLACLVGFDTYAHRANRGTMMEAPGKNY